MSSRRQKWRPIKSNLGACRPWFAISHAMRKRYRLQAPGKLVQLLERFFMFFNSPSEEHSFQNVSIWTSHASVILCVSYKKPYLLLKSSIIKNIIMDIQNFFQRPRCGSFLITDWNLNKLRTKDHKKLFKRTNTV